MWTEKLLKAMESRKLVSIYTDADEEFIGYVLAADSEYVDFVFLDLVNNSLEAKAIKGFTGDHDDEELIDIYMEDKADEDIAPDRIFANTVLRLSDVRRIDYDVNHILRLETANYAKFYASTDLEALIKANEPKKIKPKAKKKPTNKKVPASK